MTDVSEILNKTADLLQTRGWCRGFITLDGQMCMLGALSYAEHGNFNHVYSTNPTTTFLADYLEKYRRVSTEWNDLDFDAPATVIYRYNDRFKRRSILWPHFRVQRHMIKLLREAAKSAPISN